MKTTRTCSERDGLDNLDELRARYQRQLASILACSQSLLCCDAWYYDPARLDAVQEIGDHIQRAVTTMKRIGQEIHEIERRLGLANLAS